MKKLVFNNGEFDAITTGLYMGSITYMNNIDFDGEETKNYVKVFFENNKIDRPYGVNGNNKLFALGQKCESGGVVDTFCIVKHVTKYKKKFDYTEAFCFFVKRFMPVNQAEIPYPFDCDSTTDKDESRNRIRAAVHASEGINRHNYNYNLLHNEDGPAFIDCATRDFIYAIDGEVVTRERILSGLFWRDDLNDKEKAVVYAMLLNGDNKEIVSLEKIRALAK